MEQRSVPMAALAPLLEEIISRGGSVELTATGHSMEPMLRDRESRVRLAAPRPLRRGDLPLYRRADGSYVLHRVLRADADGLLCCGDAQTAPERVAPEQVRAVTEAFTDRQGRWRSVSDPRYRAYWRLRLASRGLRRVLGWLRRRLGGGAA